jgi:hypothetical protein
MNLTLYKDMFQLMTLAPPNQLDPSVSAKFKKLDPDNFESDQILAILDECAYYSLASDFTMHVLDTLWKTKLADENKTVEQAELEAAPRRSQPR